MTNQNKNQHVQMQIPNIIKKLNRIKVEIDGTIATLNHEIGKKRHHNPTRIFCKNCSRMNVRVRKDKSYFCRTCGYDSWGMK